MIKFYLSVIEKEKVYKIKIDEWMIIESCLVASINNNFLWHRRLGHISMDILYKLVKGLSYIAFKKKRLYDACQMDEQVKTSFKSNNHISTERPLELLHIELFKLTRARSISGNKYIFMTMDDFIWYT